MPSSKALFLLTAGVTTVFVITVLAMVAMLIGQPNAPINVWFNVHGATVLTVEVLSIGVFGMAAMVVDRRETLRELRDRPTQKAALRDASSDKFVKKDPLDS